MWKKLLKYRLQAQSFHSMELRSGDQTSFWHDNWSLLGRLHELLGDRGFINMRIKPEVTVADPVKLHRRRNHRMDILNNIENELDKLRVLGNMEVNIAKWHRPDGTFKSSFSTSATWQQVRREG